MTISHCFPVNGWMQDELSEQIDNTWLRRLLLTWDEEVES